jgi:hypothetical protein
VICCKFQKEDIWREKKYLDIKVIGCTNPFSNELHSRDGARLISPSPAKASYTQPTAD